MLAVLVSVVSESRGIEDEAEEHESHHKNGLKVEELSVLRVKEATINLMHLGSALRTTMMEILGRRIKK